MKGQKLVNECSYDVDAAGEPSVSGSMKYWPHHFLTECDLIFTFFVSFSEGCVEKM
jgi:hypothetical protein